MTLFKNKYRIETARLPGWDYRNAGCYFVTICAKNRIHLFGEIERDDIHLSAAGEIAARCWREIPTHHTGLTLGEFVIMPNHVHGIILLNPTEPLRATALQTATSLQTAKFLQSSTPTSVRMAAISPKAGALGSIVRSYKSAVTRLARLAGHEIAWQERYWDHIIRDNGEFNGICDYIIQNPSKWATDQESALGLWM